MEILSVNHRFSIVQNWIPLLYKMQLVLYLICILLPAMYCNEVNLPTQSKDLCILFHNLGLAIGVKSCFYAWCWGFDSHLPQRSLHPAVATSHIALFWRLKTSICQLSDLRAGFHKPDDNVRGQNIILRKYTLVGTNLRVFKRWCGSCQLQINVCHLSLINHLE